MNEICENCGHHKDDHRETPKSNPGECCMPDCDCEEYVEQETE